MIASHIIDYSLCNEIEIEELIKYNIFPIVKEELYILVARVEKEVDVESLSALFDAPIKFVEVSQNDIDNQLHNFNIYNKIYQLAIKTINHSEQSNSDNSYIIDMLDNIILFAIKQKASDIHIESLKQSVAIRFRIDGMLKLIFTFKYEMYSLFASIVKLFASLDISQIRLPQNGRFSKIFNGNDYDFRVSTMPTLNGESIVMRILDSKNSKIILKEVGFDNYIYQSLEKIINVHQGMILVTGPTGSGKTTTLYSILNTLNTVEKKIVTIEDPIEYNLAGVQQVSINEDINLDYALALKNTLRQDPDIIMIGEIRDEVALKIAMQAALTGHLVLGTIHTKSAVDTIVRLLDLNAEPFLIASTLKAVISQRLVRKKTKNGYKGRVIVAELLECDDKIAQYINERQTIQTIIEYAKTKGFKTLEENGMQKVKDGITNIEEFYAKIKM